MLYIDNLCEFIRLMIDNEETGTFYPQNSEYVKTSDMVKIIAEAHGKKIILFRYVNWAIKLLAHMPGKAGRLMNKAFGSLVYKKSMSEYKVGYCVKDLPASINATEK
jgi:UDP-glucose 4-epimerase